MVKRKKRLEKQIIGIEKQIGKHKKKMRIGEFEKDTTMDYWDGEIERFKEQAKKRKKILKKFNKSRGNK